MAKITDLDDLTRASSATNLGGNGGTDDGNIFIDTSALTIELGLQGLLTTDGVTMQAIYSYLKQEWKTDPALIKYPFPMVAITPEQFEFVDSWVPFDIDSVNLYRDGGFRISNSNGTYAEDYMGVITLGSVTDYLAADGQIYFQPVDGDEGTTDIVLKGAANQCVKIKGDGAGHGIDNASAFDTTNYFKIFAREYKMLYDQSSKEAIGLADGTFLTYQAYRFPLQNADDLKITHDDSDVSGNLPYTDMDIEYFGSNQQRTIGAGTYDFDIIIDADVAQDAGYPTTAEIYEYIQYQLRQTGTIDTGSTVVGNVANLLLKFVGDTLVTSSGVYIDRFAPTAINTIEFYDVLGTKRVFPYVAAGSINFNANLSGDSGAVYRMFFTDISGQNFGDSDAILVHSNETATGTDIAFAASSDITSSTSDLSVFADGDIIHVEGTSSNDGFYTVSGTPTTTALTVLETSIADESSGSSFAISKVIGSDVPTHATDPTSDEFTFDYQSNDQGGRTPDTDAPVTIVAIGLDKAQYVKSTGTILKSAANNFSLVASLERNYLNPA